MNTHAPSAGKGPRRDLGREHTWRQLLRQFAASGQSIREFCATRQLPETAFYSWRGETQRRDGRAASRRQPATRRPPAFTQVLVQPPLAPAAEGPRLRLGDGRELLLPASWAPAQRAALIHAIEDAA